MSFVNSQAFNYYGVRMLSMLKLIRMQITCGIPLKFVHGYSTSTLLSNMNKRFGFISFHLYPNFFYDIEIFY